MCLLRALTFDDTLTLKLRAGSDCSGFYDEQFKFLFLVQYPVPDIRAQHEEELDTAWFFASAQAGLAYWASPGKLTSFHTVWIF